MVDEKMLAWCRLFFFYLFLCELLPLPRVIIKIAHTSPKSATKRIKSSHACGLSAKIHGLVLARRESHFASNRRRATKFSLKSLKTETVGSAIRERIARGPIRQIREKRENYIDRARVIDRLQNARFNGVLVELALNAAQGSL